MRSTARTPTIAAAPANGRRDHTRSRVRLLAIALTASLAVVLVLPATSGATSEKGRPLVSTGGVKKLHGSSVELEGTIDPHGLVTTYYFLYGPTVPFAYQTPRQTLDPEDEHVPVGAQVLDFPVGYSYLLVAENSAGTRQGRDKRYGKSGVLKFELPKSLSPVSYEHGLTLSGKLVGSTVENVPVALQETAYPFLDAFGEVGAAQETGAGGSFTFHVASLSESVKFRVVAKEPRPAYSAILTQQVMPRVVLKVQKTAVKGLVRLYGTVTPAQTGARVLLQLDQPVRPGNSEKASERTMRFATQFSTIARRATKRMSRFSVIATVKHAGEYRAYVDLRRGPLTAGASASIKLTAASPKRKKS